MLHFRSPVEESLLNKTSGSLAALGSVQMPEFSVSGLSPAAVIDTARGPVLARDLHAGDRVVTRDHGLQPIRWVGCSSVIYEDENGLRGEGPHAAPVRIRAGALGGNAQAGNLVLAPGQRILLRHSLTELYFATPEVMAAIGDLTHLDGVDQTRRDTGRWIHVLLDNHELLNVNGLWMESFAPDMPAIRIAFPEVWEAITTALPKLRYENTRADYVEARLTLDAQEALLFDAI